MGLFSDFPICGIEDLRLYESNLPDIAGAEGVEIGSKIRLAYDRVGHEIRLFLTVLGNAEPDPLGSILVNPDLVSWVAQQALLQFFRDCFGQGLNKRYEAKIREYQDGVVDARRRFLASGVVTTAEPVPRAEVPDVDVTAGGGLSGGVIYLKSQLVGATGATGSPSDLTHVTVSEGQKLTVSQDCPPNATGWLLFAGDSPETCRRQSNSTIGPQASFALTMLAANGAEPVETMRPSRTWKRSFQRRIG